MSFTGRFSDRADAYVAGRPSYPDAAIDTLFEGLGDPHEAIVVDLGAGTGISSRLLAGRGACVIAVEPNGPMRAAAEPHPGVTWVDGTAEQTGLDEASADLVTAFQAFHWFDHDAALREMVRVLRPGGRAALVYNERDERDPFTADYGELVRRYQTDRTERGRANGRAAFAAYPAWHAARVVEIPNAQRLDRAGVHARARSTSYLPQEGAAFVELRAALDALFEEHAVDGAVTMRLLTIVSIGDVGADGA